MKLGLIASALENNDTLFEICMLRVAIRAPISIVLARNEKAYVSQTSWRWMSSASLTYHRHHSVIRMKNLVEGLELQSRLNKNVITPLSKIMLSASMQIVTPK